MHNVGKRFHYDWIFQNINLSFHAEQKYALSGPNGSGKSTFLRLVSGHLTPTKGKIEYKLNGKVLDIDKVYRQLSIAAPYIELIEEMTLEEAIRFHRRFKEFYKDVDLVEILRFSKYREQEIRFFSSGMKQRLKLALAICSHTPMLLLDEPGTNLDHQGLQWYRRLMSEFAKQRMVIIASNLDSDFDFCENQIDITHYKDL